MDDKGFAWMRFFFQWFPSHRDFGDWTLRNSECSGGGKFQKL